MGSGRPITAQPPAAAVWAPRSSPRTRSSLRVWDFWGQRRRDTWGGGPESDGGLRSRLYPARVPSRGLRWREGAGLPGRRDWDGAGVSAIDRLGRCREAFRPASESRSGAEVWASPSPKGGRPQGFLSPPQPAHLQGLQALPRNRVRNPICFSPPCYHAGFGIIFPGPIIERSFTSFKVRCLVHCRCLWVLGLHTIRLWNIPI